MRHRPRQSAWFSPAFAVAVIGAVIVSSGCANMTTVTLPSCSQQFEVDGEHRRQGPRTLVFDHSLDPPWSSTEIVIDKDGAGSAPPETVRFGNTSPNAGRLVGALVLTTISAAVATTAIVDMSDGRVANYGPFYGVVFGSIGTAFGTFLGLTGWGPGHNINLEKICTE